MAVIREWSTTELEQLAAVVTTRDQGVLQSFYDQRASEALFDFARIQKQMAKNKSRKTHD